MSAIGVYALKEPIQRRLGWGGFCLGGILSRGDFVRGGYCPGDIVQVDIILELYINAWYSRLVLL